MLQSKNEVTIERATEHAAEPARDASVPVAASRATSLRVMKFGGTSVASAQRLRRIADLTAAALAENRVALVLSAVSGVTDLLLDGLRDAAAGRPAEVVGRYRALHAGLAGELARDLGGERFHALFGALEALSTELEERLPESSG